MLILDAITAWERCSPRDSFHDSRMLHGGCRIGMRPFCQFLILHSDPWLEAPYFSDTVPQYSILIVYVTLVLFISIDRWYRSTSTSAWGSRNARE